jgi:3-oxoacyl-(acyl-carrier-protein) synthase
MYISSYECITAAGLGVKSLLTALSEQRVCASTLSGGLVCQIPMPNKTSSSEKNARTPLEGCFNTLRAALQQTDPPRPHKKFGIVLASTKGILEDFKNQWTPENIRSFQDPYNPLLKDFISQILLKNISSSQILFSVVISNACSSSPVAIEFAQDCFDNSDVDFILVLSVDVLGPFVYQGFDSLRVLSHTKNKPFDQFRDGLQLGEATAMILLSRKPLYQNDIFVDAVCSKTMASSITRPSPGGEGLLGALDGLRNSTNGDTVPDFFVAHGTGTVFNDAAEDEAYQKYLIKLQSKLSVPVKIPLVLNTKWCIGHTLGVSGSLDIIAACEVLKTQKPFNNPSLTQLDSKFSHGKVKYIFDSHLSYNFKTAIVTSLGFGGVQAAIRLTHVSVSQVSDIKINNTNDHTNDETIPKNLLFECNVNHRATPIWKNQVERWSQLDENTYALCSAINEWYSQNLLPKECNILLISIGGSNIADYEFVKTGMISPSKFVYTLPNVALAAISQIWGWSGKAFVLIKDHENNCPCLASWWPISMAIRSSKKKKQSLLILESPPKLNKDFRRVQASLYL